MARFRATIHGQRGPASRLGSANSGIQTDTNGWQSGIRVVGHVDNVTGRDTFSVYATSGSDGRGLETYLGMLEQDQHGVMCFRGYRVND